MRLSTAIRARIRFVGCVVVFLFLLGWSGTAMGDSPTIVRVEEDWELVVLNPEPYTAAPQITCVISPTGDIGSVHSTFEVNQQPLPAFVPGGLQIQLWCGDAPLWDRRSHGFALLAQENEAIRWTQAMYLHDGYLLFEVTGGTSATWGSFGDGHLKVGCPTEIRNLNGYSPDVSVANSTVGYAGNRVQLLTLKAVRLVTSSGEIIQDTTARVVHQEN